MRRSLKKGIKPGLFTIICLLYLLTTGCQERRDPFTPQPIRSSFREVVPLEIGASLPSFSLPGTDGQWYSPTDFSTRKLLVIAFLSNSCAHSQAYEDRLIDFMRDYEQKVEMVVISPNSPISVPDDAMGYADLDDTYASMQIRAREKSFNFPYLYDGDLQDVSAAFGPTSLPYVFVFDKKRTLRYRGRIDFNSRWKAANAEDLRLSVDAILRNDEIIRPAREPLGCPVFWSWDSTEQTRLRQEWTEAPVLIKEIDEDSLKSLKVNFSGKLRIFYFWSPDSRDCLDFFPELMKMKRMYRYRPVEFNTVALVNLQTSAVAQNFLMERHVAGYNYILPFPEGNSQAPIIHESWDGKLPFVLLIDPLESVVQSQYVPLDAYQLRKSIVEHRLLGRYL